MTPNRLLLRYLFGFVVCPTGCCSSQCGREHLKLFFGSERSPEDWCIIHTVWWIVFFHFTVLVSIVIIKYVYITLYIHTSDSVIYIYWLQNTYIETCPYNCPCSLISDNIFGSFLVGGILHAFMEDCQSLGTWHNVYIYIYLHIYIYLKFTWAVSSVFI